MRGFFAKACRLFVCITVSLLVACSSNKAKEEQASNPSPKPSVSPSSEPSETAQILALAEQAYQAKDWQTAETNYVKITRAIPKEAHPWFRLGNIYARTERPDFAVRAYKEALLRDSSLSKAWYNMGLIQLRQSANSFLQMRSYTPDNSQAQNRADAMYESIIDVIKNGPNQARAYAQDEVPTNEPAWIAIPDENANQAEPEVEVDELKSEPEPEPAQELEDTATEAEIDVPPIPGSDG